MFASVSSPILVEMTGITKRFPEVIANDRVDLVVREGEVRALLGENGAGKTTLVNILAGLYQPEEGEIRWRGTRVAIRSPRDASRLGIGMVHQHFTLVPSFTVVENVLLGIQGHGEAIGVVAARLAQLGREYGLAVDPRARVGQLSVGEQQRVELLRQLYLGARLLILDEPTAALTPQESSHLFEVVRAMAGQGHGVILITHKLPEVMAVADTITVLRHGKVTGSLRRDSTNESSLAALMVGHALKGVVVGPRTPPGAPVFSLEDVSCLSDRGYTALHHLTLHLRAGSVLGIAGVAGNGQRELAEVASGLRRPAAGRIIVGGKDLTGAPPGVFIRAGVFHVPEDRLGTGLAPGLRVWENLNLRVYSRPPINRRGFLDLGAARHHARGMAAHFNVQAPSLELPVRFLSGGNLQKVVLARELSSAPVVLIAAHPTRGLDVAATELVHRLLLDGRRAGMGVLLISEDLDELLVLADRILVLYRGQVIGETAAATADRQLLGLWMAGIRQGVEPSRDHTS